MIAFDYTIIFDGRAYLWLCCYDQSFHRLSPGRATLLDIIRFAFDQNLAEVDYMQGDEPYKSRWETGRRQAVSLDVVLNRVGHRLRSYAERRMRPTVKKLLA